MSARFEVVRTDAGHHARFIAPNGKTVWTTEIYTRKRGAINAIETLTGFHNGGGVQTFVAWHGGTVEIRHVDERLHKVARPELPAHV